MEESIKKHTVEPDLTGNIEKKLHSLIDTLEQQAVHDKSFIDSKLYLQLADLYHFHHRYTQEVEVLKRFTHFKFAQRDELVAILERIESVKELIGESTTTNNNLNLVLTQKPADTIFKAESQLKSAAKKVAHSNTQPFDAEYSAQVNVVAKQGKIPFAQTQLKIATVSAAYTGKSDRDEIVQLAILLFEYVPTRMKRSKILGTFWGERKTKVEIPDKVINEFSFGLAERELLSFDKSKAIDILSQADFIVSHNDAETERKLLATIFPELVDIPWYSSERDIPWRAMGYESSKLIHLAVEFNERKPQTCMDRAVAISRLLQKEEPSSTQTFLERLYNMQPMKPFEWSNDLIKQAKRNNRGQLDPKLLITSSVAVAVIVALAIYLWIAGVF